MPPDRSKVLQQAQLLASRGQYDAAIAEWKKLATEAPNDGSIHNSIGDLHLKRNSSSEAIAAFLQAAAAFRAEGATLKAIAAYKKVLKVDPSRYEVYRHLGDLNAERGLLSSAVQDYLTLGKYYLKERKSKEALEIYKRIVSQDPSNLDAQQRVAELCVQENLQDEATKVYLQLGRERSAQGRYDEARDAYLAVLRIDPKNSEAAQFVESVAKGAIGTVQTIKAVKRGAAPASQKSSEPIDLLAEATRRIEEKQYAGAEAILNQMLSREPGNPQVCQLLARLHLQRGDVQVALGEYRFLAGAALRAQDYILAESLIGEYLAADPNCVPLLELYGQLYEEKGDRMAAAQQYARAVELLLDHPEPGMESLHEELFEKVKSLAADSDLVKRLSARFAGEPQPETGSGSTEPACEGAAQDAAVEAVEEAPVNGFSIRGAEPDDLWTTKSKPPVNQDRHFSPADAAPDGDGSVGGSTRRFEREFSLANAAPDGDGLRMSQPVASKAAGPLEDVPMRGAPGAVVVSADPSSQENVAEPVGQSRSVDEAASTSPVSAAAPAPDYEAHFTLGVAFKNMGLYAEAKEEFEVAKSANAFYLDACLMTALCLKEEGEIGRAIQGLEAVLADPRCEGAKGQAIRYELGLLYEAEAQWENAARTFQTIPSFHDVPQRLQSLKDRAHPAFRLAS